MVRNLAFILYVLSHVITFFFIMVNFLKKKQKKTKKKQAKRCSRLRCM